MAIAAGKLDRRILIQRPVVVRDEHGDEIEGWVDVATVWAEFKRTGGNEEFRASQTSNVQTVAFRIRFRAGLDPKMTVVYEGRRYDILDVGESEDGRRVGITLTCEAREISPGSS